MIEKKVGIIGKPLSHSLSPTLHNFWFKKNKIPASYSLIEIELHDIEKIIKKIKKIKYIKIMLICMKIVPKNNFYKL